MEFTLTCNSPAERGVWGLCRVATEDAEVNPNKIRYAWSAAGNVRSGKGPGFTSWGGVATTDREIVVKISGEGIRAVTLRHHFRVDARSGWGVPELRATADYAHRGWPNTRWGLHTMVPPTSFPVVLGQGPWFGQFIASRAPTVDSRLELHADLSPGGPRYGDADRTCAASSSLRSRENLHAVNGRCGTGADLSAFGALVLEHERDHEESLNACLRSATGQATMRAMESVLRSSASEAEDDLRDVWRIFYRNSFRPAHGGNISSSTGPAIWHHRSADSWLSSALTIAGHGGTWSC